MYTFALVNQAIHPFWIGKLVVCPNILFNIFGLWAIYRGNNDLCSVGVVKYVGGSKVDG